MFGVVGVAGGGGRSWGQPPRWFKNLSTGSFFGLLTRLEVEDKGRSVPGWLGRTRDVLFRGCKWRVALLLGELSSTAGYSQRIPPLPSAFSEKGKQPSGSDKAAQVCERASAWGRCGCAEGTGLARNIRVPVPPLRRLGKGRDCGGVVGAVGARQGQCRGIAWWTGVFGLGPCLRVCETRKVQRTPFSDGAVARGRA